MYAQVKPKFELWVGVDSLRLQLLHTARPFVDTSVEDVEVTAIGFEDQSGGLTLSVGSVSVIDKRPTAAWREVLSPSKAHVIQSHTATSSLSRGGARHSRAGSQHSYGGASTYAGAGAGAGAGVSSPETGSPDDDGGFRLPGGGLSEALQRLQGARGLRIDAEGRSMRLITAHDQRGASSLLLDRLDQEPLRNPMAPSQGGAGDGVHRAHRDSGDADDESKGVCVDTPDLARRRRAALRGNQKSSRSQSRGPPMVRSLLGAWGVVWRVVLMSSWRRYVADSHAGRTW